LAEEEKPTGITRVMANEMVACENSQSRVPAMRLEAAPSHGIAGSDIEAEQGGN